MTTPAPYNRATLNRIRREGVSAAQLGWSEERYVRVCRDHGIEWVGATLSSVASFIAIESKPMTAAQANRDPIRKRDTAKPIPEGAAQSESPIAKDAPRWDVRTGKFCCGSACVTIKAPMQARIMNILFDSYCIHRDLKIGGIELATIIGTGTASTRGHIWCLVDKIKPLGWTVDGNKGRGGGYCLAPARSLLGAAP